MIFGSRLLSSFSMSAFYCFSSATYFLTLCEIATLVWVVTHTMGLIAYFTSRCKVRCADQSRGTHWDGQKNKVLAFSRDAKINTAAAFNIQRGIADSFINWLCKTKKKVAVLLHNFLCILISRSLPYLKEMYVTAFRHKLIHNSITQSKASRSIWRHIAASFHNSGRLLHHTQYARSRWCTVHCTPLQQLWIYDSFDDCWFAKHCTISVFKMSRQTDFQKL